jgi:hypothetical protein
MPKKRVSSSALLRKHLGKKSGDALLRKINKMVASGAGFTKIERAVSQHLADHMQQQIASAVAPTISLVPAVFVKSVLVNSKIEGTSTMGIHRGRKSK